MICWAEPCPDLFGELHASPGPPNHPCGTGRSRGHNRTGGMAKEEPWSAHEECRPTRGVTELNMGSVEQCQVLDYPWGEGNPEAVSDETLAHVRSDASDGDEIA